ncbi:hypothetical protein K438DRAFT_1785462 [Mycena galopus ATCC 62051]|nr:hypothetical protein K438DRAFT_1785462 [Mycena galopus ATCC 62051]
MPCFPPATRSVAFLALVLLLCCPSIPFVDAKAARNATKRTPLRNPHFSVHESLRDALIFPRFLVDSDILRNITRREGEGVERRDAATLEKNALMVAATQRFAVQKAANSALTEDVARWEQPAVAATAAATPERLAAKAGGGECLSGEQCCGEKNCFSDDEQCCTGGNVCLKDDTCCGSECCPQGDTCCGGTTCCSGEACCDGSQAVPSRTIPTPSAGSGATGSPTTTKVPKTTITFKYYPKKMVKNSSGKRIPLSNKAILMNMCEGIKKYLMGTSANEVQLTKSKANQASNRAIMCPPGFCADALQEYAKLYPDLDPADLQIASGMSCDEFPFASSLQGGNKANGVSICVESWENSWQGGTMSRKISSLVDGDDFLVRIEGWDCDKQAPVPKSVTRNTQEPVYAHILVREDDSDSDSLTGDDLFTGFDDSDNALIMSLGDLSAGKYTYTLELSTGRISSAFVADYVGNQYYASTVPFNAGGGKFDISFTLDQGAYGVGLVAVQDPAQGNLTLNYTTAKTSSGVTSLPVLSIALPPGPFITLWGISSLVSLFL